MTDNLIYEEKVNSNWTTVLFLAFTILFLILLIWRLSTDNPDVFSVLFFFLFAFFFFYSINYRTLIIRITPESLNLKFGIFTWTIPLDNVSECHLDDLPVLMKYGGAGIHFMFIRKRYRASYNFLEHPRVVIKLNRKVWIVQDVSFTTRRPDAVIQLVQNAVSTRNAT